MLIFSYKGFAWQFSIYWNSPSRYAMRNHPERCNCDPGLWQAGHDIFEKIMGNHKCGAFVGKLRFQFPKRPNTSSRIGLDRHLNLWCARDYSGRPYLAPVCPTVIRLIILVYYFFSLVDNQYSAIFLPIY